MFGEEMYDSMFDDVDGDRPATLYNCMSWFMSHFLDEDYGVRLAALYLVILLLVICVVVLLVDSIRQRYDHALLLRQQTAWAAKRYIGDDTLDPRVDVGDTEAALIQMRVNHDTFIERARIQQDDMRNTFAEAHANHAKNLEFLNKLLHQQKEFNMNIERSFSKSLGVRLDETQTSNPEPVILPKDPNTATVSWLSINTESILPKSMSTPYHTASIAKEIGPAFQGGYSRRHKS